MTDLTLYDDSTALDIDRQVVRQFARKLQKLASHHEQRGDFGEAERLRHNARRSIRSLIGLA